MAGVLSNSRQATSRGAQFHHKKALICGPTTTRGQKNISRSTRNPKPGEDYQYIMKSSVPTMHFQASLPRLPVPELKKTCERYIRAQRPLLNSEFFKSTESAVEDFIKNEGVQCQNLLVSEDKQNKHTSYISKPWFDMYLTARVPLPINYNPFMVMVRHPVSEYNNQVTKASNLVISSLRFFKSLNDSLLEPEVYHMNPTKSNTPLFWKFTGLLPQAISWYGAYFFKAFPLDMSQFPNLFNTNRIPEIGKDCIKHVDGGRHLMVMRKGNIYVFDVIDKDGNIVHPDVILGSISAILHNKEPAAEFPVGVLTTENRDVWAAARSHLVSIGNMEVLDLIDSSLFTLVLDEETPGSEFVSLVRLFLHADGANRWFDKSFSLIVTGDGTAGVNFEHSWGDGVAVLRYLNSVHEDSIKNPCIQPTMPPTHTPTIKKLEFKLDDKMKTIISEAKTKYTQICNSLEVRVLDYHKFGRSLCKPLSISPDAMMQLSFQIAYDQMADKQVASYESCSTSAFKHGRTDTVRPCTIETKKLCKALKQSSPPSRKELQHMIVDCSKYHSKLIKEAAMGLGFDRHLFALKLKAEALGLKPAVFSDPAYAAINHNILSTSTLLSDNIMLGAFGPVVKDGFGIAYSIWNERLGSIVTNYKGQSNGSGFVDALQYSLDQLHDILKD